MNKFLAKIAVPAMLAVPLLGALPLIASADSIGPIDFESPYTVGNINGQQGWSSTGSYDQGVVSSPVISGSQSFRISNAVTSGSFGDQTFAPALTQAAGETGANNAGFGSGPFQTHFESSFTIKAIPNSIGDFLSVSPDQGNGARMSYLGFDNEADGIHVNFYDVQGTSNSANFVETVFPTVLDSSVAHTVKFSMDFVDGPSNDVVKIYIDGVLVHTGTSWENYYRFDPESNPTLDPNFTPTVRTMLFRAGGTAVPANLGKGYLIDNLSIGSGDALSFASLAAQDFGVMNFSGVKGYTAGFGLTNAVLASTTSVVVQLYSGSTLLQTNTATPLFQTLPGTDFSSPFDVFGTFNYVTDGYWTNVRETEYGQTLIPTRVVATVTLSNGKVLTAENTNLTGDPTTIFPLVTTNPATAITQTDATLNGTNGAVAATGHSFWVSLAPISTVSSTIPAGVYSTPDMGAIAANTPFSASLSSLTTSGVPGNMPAVTPNTTYYFVAWSLVNGTWTPGEVLNFTTLPVPPTTPGSKEACMSGGWKTYTDGTNHFKNQGDCVSFVATGGKNKAAGH